MSDNVKIVFEFLKEHVGIHRAINFDFSVEPFTVEGKIFPELTSISSNEMYGVLDNLENRGIISCYPSMGDHMAIITKPSLFDPDIMSGNSIVKIETGDNTIINSTVGNEEFRWKLWSIITGFASILGWLIGWKQLGWWFFGL